MSVDYTKDEIKRLIDDMNESRNFYQQIKISGNKDTLSDRYFRAKSGQCLSKDYQRKNTQSRVLDELSEESTKANPNVFFVNTKKNFDKLKRVRHPMYTPDKDIYLVTDIEDKIGKKVGNKFDITHIDSYSKYPHYMKKKGLTIVRLGLGLAVMVPEISHKAFHNFEFIDEKTESTKIDYNYPLLYRISQNNDVESLSEALIMDVARECGILKWVHYGDINDSRNLHTLTAHRTNETFSFQIDNKNFQYKDIQIETDGSSSEEESGENICVYETKALKPKEVREDFAVYQLYNPYRKNILRNNYGKNLNQEAVYLTGKLNTDASELTIDTYVYKFKDDMKLDSIYLIKKHRFLISI